MRKMTIATAVMWLGLTATAAQAAETAPPPCQTHAEANAFFTAVLPDILGGIGKTCSTVLPENATLRGGLPSLLARYQAPADAAWPPAMTVFAKIGGKELKGVDPKLLRPLIGPMMGNMIAEDVKPADCPKVDRIATLLAPLPSTNLAELVVLFAEFGTSGKKDSPFTICPADGAAPVVTSTARP
jgi:hypothetical protein